MSRCNNKVYLVLQNFKDYDDEGFKQLNQISQVIVIPFEQTNKYFCIMINKDDIKEYKNNNLILQLTWDKQYRWMILNKEPDIEDISNIDLFYEDLPKTLLSTLKNLRQDESFKQKS